MVPAWYCHFGKANTKPKIRSAVCRPLKNHCFLWFGLSEFGGGFSLGQYHFMDKERSCSCFRSYRRESFCCYFNGFAVIRFFGVRRRIRHLRLYEFIPYCLRRALYLFFCFLGGRRLLLRCYIPAIQLLSYVHNVSFGGFPSILLCIFISEEFYFSLENLCYCIDKQ